MTAPNTNPSDLDREALDKACEAAGDTYMAEEQEGLAFDVAVKAGIVAYLSALPRTSGVPEAEAVAWRWKCKGVEQPWSCTDDAGFIGWILENKHKYIVDELYAAPPPVAAPSGEALRYAAQFLIDRLEDFELDETNAKEMCRQYLGFVEPAIDRLKMELASPIASEPKDAGSGEGQDWQAKWDAHVAELSNEEQELTWQEEVAALHLADATKLRQDHAERVVNQLHAMGMRITRTAPSGAKPGEV